MGRLARKLIVGVAMLAMACENAGDRQQREALETLVTRQGNRSDAERALGGTYVLYQKGAPSWRDLESFLDREPKTALRPLRDAFEKYPTIMYYTTAYRMTWVYLDERQIVQGFSFAAQ